MVIIRIPTTAKLVNKLQRQKQMGVTDTSRLRRLRKVMSLTKEKKKLAVLMDKA
jgi:hypothetical protein